MPTPRNQPTGVLKPIPSSIEHITAGDDRRYQEMTSRLIMQQRQETHVRMNNFDVRLNQVEVRLNNIENILTSLKDRMMKDYQTDPGEQQQGGVQASNAWKDPTPILMRYDEIDRKLKEMNLDFPRSILYFIVEKAEISYGKLDSKTKTHFTSAHYRRRKLFIPFIKYVTAQIGELPPRETGAANLLWTREASRILKDLVASVKAHLVERKVIDGGRNLTATVLLRHKVSKEMKEFLRSRTIAVIQQKLDSRNKQS
jgi:hypothetical protein